MSTNASMKLIILDRDGVINYDSDEFIKSPDEWIPIPGSLEAIARLNQAGYKVIVASNQSGIARGLLSEADYEATASRLDDLLAAAQARIDGRYHCPHLPEITGPCECRKPGALLYERAARDLELDLLRSWWVGDRLRDLEAAARFGGRGTLVLTGAGPTESQRPESAWPTAPDLAAAVQRILAGDLG